MGGTRVCERVYKDTVRRDRFFVLWHPPEITQPTITPCRSPDRCIARSLCARRHCVGGVLEGRALVALSGAVSCELGCWNCWADGVDLAEEADLAGCSLPPSAKGQLYLQIRTNRAISNLVGAGPRCQHHQGCGSSLRDRRFIPKAAVGRSGVAPLAWAIDDVRYPRCYGHFQHAEIGSK